MIISREYTVSAKTTLANKDVDKLGCPKGTLTRIRFLSAPGVNYEVYGRIVHFEDSIVPNETGEWLALAGTVQEFTPNWNKWNNVYELYVELCSPDARYEHVIQVEIEVEEAPTIQQLFALLLKGVTR